MCNTKLGINTCSYLNGHRIKFAIFYPLSLSDSLSALIVP